MSNETTPVAEDSAAATDPSSASSSELEARPDTHPEDSPGDRPDATAGAVSEASPGEPLAAAAAPEAAIATAEVAEASADAAEAPAGEGPTEEWVNQSLSDKTFEELGVEPSILQALTEMGYERPMKVQAAVFEQVMAGRDLQVQARTGTGKTTAFGLPLVQQISAENKGPQALILAPTRELALQVSRELEALAKHKGLHVLPVYGGAPMGPQIKAFKDGAQIIAGTPGRVLDHLGRRTFRPDDIRALVLDECDEMLSMGFQEEIEKIIAHLPKESRQTLLFSATIPSEIQRIANRHMRDPEQISLSEGGISVDAIDHFYYVVTGLGRHRDLLKVLLVEKPESAIIFCNTREDTAMVAKFLQRNGYDAEAISSDLTQRDRERVMARMRAGKIGFLVATDVAARGIDIESLSHVINYAFPESPEVYVHRTGRTGRAGKSGRAVSLVGPREIGSFYYLKLIYKIRPTECELPTSEEIAAIQEAERYKQVVALVPDTPSEEHRALARRVWQSTEGERIFGALLQQLFAKPKKQPVARDERSDEVTEARDEARGPRDDEDTGEAAQGERRRSYDDRGRRDRDRDRDRDRGGRRSRRDRDEDRDGDRPRRRRRRRDEDRNGDRAEGRDESRDEGRDELRTDSREEAREQGRSEPPIDDARAVETRTDDARAVETRTDDDAAEVREVEPHAAGDETRIDDVGGEERGERRRRRRRRRRDADDRVQAADADDAADRDSGDEDAGEPAAARAHVADAETSTQDSAPEAAPETAVEAAGEADPARRGRRSRRSREELSPPAGEQRADDQEAVTAENDEDEPTEGRRRRRRRRGPGRDEARGGEPRGGESRREEPRRAESGREESGREESGREESGREESGREESRREEPRRAESRREEPRRAESRREESRREEPRDEKRQAKRAKAPAPVDDDTREFWETWADEKAAASTASEDEDEDDNRDDEVSARERNGDEERPRKRSRRRRGKGAQDADTSSRDDDDDRSAASDTARLYVNIGKREELTAGEIRTLLSEGLEDDIAARLGSVSLRNTHCYVRVPEDIVEDVIDAVDGRDYKGRELVVERARR